MPMTNEYFHFEYSGVRMYEKIQDLFIILVEPSDTQRKIIEGEFSELGITNFLSLGSGKELLDRVKQDKPDLVIATMHLPDMTSIELVKLLRKDAGTQDLHFMLITTVTSFNELDPIKQAGATAVLPKPFTTAQLKTALYSSLDNLEPDQIMLEDFDVESLNVLVVDDSRMARRQIIRTLTKMGIEKFTEAPDGADAIPLIDEEYFDLIVTDYNMPEMDGHSLLDYIRTKSHQPTVPVLMVTTEENTSKLSAVEQSGVSGICDKPFEPATVKRLIESIMVA